MAENHSHYRKQGDRDHAEKLRHHMAAGGDLKQDKALIKKAFDEHDAQLHDGKKTRLKLAKGGHVEGEKAKHRLDRASGGRAANRKMGGKSGHKTTVNIVMPQGQGQDRPVPVPVPAAAGAMSPRPPMAAPPPGGAPAGGGMPMGAGAPPPRPPMGPPASAGAPMPMRKRGGRVSESEPAGAGGGMGRLAKIKDYGKQAEGDLEDRPFEADSENKKMARGGRR